MTKPPIIWALTDGKTGNDNQTLAVAQKLGVHEVKPIQYSWLAKLHNCFLGASSLGIKTKFTAPYPDIILSCGRRPARVARLIKKRSPSTIAIQQQWIACGHKDFDLIFTPEHDNIKPHKNLINILTPPNRITPELLNSSAEKWQPRIPITTKPAIAVLVGNISTAEAKKLINILNYAAAYPMITTSRRTNPEIVKMLETEITSDRYFYPWGSQAENPYLGFISLTDFIIVSEDSVSMLGEAVSTGKPVYIFPTQSSHKHKNFSDSLINSGYARTLQDENLQTYSYQPLNTLDFIVKKIREKIEN